MAEELTDDDDGGSEGAPMWMATFADLMSLLMCFFVLLLSFSEMDVQKYKQMAGSMRFAFGVQNTMRVQEIPMGTSVIADEFSAGQPDPTIFNVIEQTTNETENPTQRTNIPGGLNEQAEEEMLAEQLQELLRQTAADADTLRKALSEEIEAGILDVETSGRIITIRIRETGSFPSASAEITATFLPVLDKIRQALNGVEGKIVIEGHTDNIPIKGGKYASNWLLSASRAVAVAQELMKNPNLSRDRFMVVGLADTQPLLPNKDTVSRALNRRVEILIRQGLEVQRNTGLNDLEDAYYRMRAMMDEAKDPSPAIDPNGVSGAWNQTPDK